VNPHPVSHYILGFIIQTPIPKLMENRNFKGAYLGTTSFDSKKVAFVFFTAESMSNLGNSISVND